MLGICLALIDSEEDKIKFQEIYESYKKQMWYTAKEILKDNQLSEDAVHDAFLGIAKNFSKINSFSEAGLRSYIITCARNSALKYQRKSKGTEIINIEGAFDLEDFKASEEFFKNEAAELAASILEKMPPLYSEVLYLRFIAEMTDKEIAVQLGRKEAAIRQQIMRGRKIFTEIFKKETEHVREKV